MITAAIAGCGAISQIHAGILNTLENISLCACADIVFERAKKMADQYGCRAYNSVDSMLSEEHPDVLHICTPHPTHTPIAKLAARHGVHVFSEKPPAVNPDQWNELSLLKGIRIGVCFQNRLNPTVQAAKSLITSGKAGSIKGARAFVCWNRGSEYYTGSDWRGSWLTEGGGMLINQSIHTLDLLVYLLGAPSFHETHMTNHHLKGIIEVEDTVESYLCLGGVPTLFYATSAYADDAPVFLEIVCEKATLRIEEPRLTIVWACGRTEEPILNDLQLPGKSYWGGGHLPCIREFYRCLREKAPFLNDLANTSDTMHLMFSMYESCRSSLKKS